MSLCKHCEKPIDQVLTGCDVWFHTHLQLHPSACQYPPITYATPKEEDQ